VTSVNRLAAFSGAMLAVAWATGCSRTPLSGCALGDEACADSSDAASLANDARATAADSDASSSVDSSAHSVCATGSHPSGGYCVPDGDVIGSSAPCLTGGNVVSIAQGGRAAQAVKAAYFSAYLDPQDTSAPTVVSLRIDGTEGQPPPLIIVVFGSTSPLAQGIYDDTLPPYANGAPKPTGNDLEVTANWGCQGPGRFQVQRIEMRGTTLSAFTATFEQDCQGNGRVRGCVHFEQ
jgi:hypothetical protein